MTQSFKRDEGSHRLDKSDMTDSPIRKSLRTLKLNAANSKAIRQLLTSLAESDDIVESFFQDCAELNPYTALMILEGYEQDGFYKLGTARALHKLLTSFVEEASVVVKHDFATPVWLLTPEKIARIKNREKVERVEAKLLEKKSHTMETVEAVAAVKHCTILQFPGLPRK